MQNIVFSNEKWTNNVFSVEDKQVCLVVVMERADVKCCQIDAAKLDELHGQMLLDKIIKHSSVKIRCPTSNFHMTNCAFMFCQSNLKANCHIGFINKLLSNDVYEFYYLYLYYKCIHTIVCEFHIVCCEALCYLH